MRFSALLVLVLVCPGALVAQEPTVPRPAPVASGGGYDHSSAPSANAVRLSGAISIDGSLTEAAWSTAPSISGLRQVVPTEGSPVSEATDVRILYDDDAIYLAARLDDRSPVTTRLARRDAGLGDSDRFTVLIDSYHDHETAYRFWTNPSGVKGDAVVTGNAGGGGGGGGGGGDSSWDPVWDLATGVGEGGWVVEMRIPFSQLRFGRDEIQTWGFQVERSINRNQENATFPFTPALERSGVSRFAHLQGISGLDPGRRLELLPYGVTRGEYLQVARPAGVAFDNPYRSGSDYFGGVGLDLKYGLASNVTLDATVNPDFGQVEVDPSVINLTAFETRYDERRPFFVEGADIFTFGEAGPTGSVGRPPEMFYSRRIGKAPTGSAPGSAAFSDMPTSTTIMGAAKVTGRLGSGWSLGIMEAFTGRESAPYVDAAASPGEIEVEPAGNHLVGRLRRQIRGGRTRFGVMATAQNRDLGGSPLETRLHSSAYTAGVDFAHDSDSRVWLFTGAFAASRVSGSEAALLRTQQTSARYYQRPDADHLEVDSAATSLGGYYAMAYVGKQAGTFTMRNGFAYVSPGYEVNDLGFQSDADRILVDTHYQYSQPTPGRFFRSWNTAISPDGKFNTAGDLIFANVNAMLNTEWLNYWRANLRVQVDPWYDDDRLTRGGPMARTPGSWQARVNVNSDGRRATRYNASYNYFTDRAGGWSRSYDFGVSVRFRETINFNIGPSYSRSRSMAQYVRRVADPTATDMFGARYVFAELDRSTVSLDTRLDVTLSPALSLQLYLEPFLSVGQYRHLKELRRPGTYAFDEYGVHIGSINQNPAGDFDIDPDGSGPAAPFTVLDRNLDFSQRSLIGNAVLRWEWRQGSTLYLVWQQRRVNRVSGHSAGTEPWVGNLEFGRDVGDMFGAPADDILMIKMNYWLNP